MASDGDRRESPLVSLIRQTAQRAKDCGFFFDFDGTLSPIVDNPAAAVPAPGILAGLTRLAARVKRVSIVSSRPVSMLAPIFQTLPVRLFGLYGLESADEAGRRATEPAAEEWIPVIEAVMARARAELPSGVAVEDKRLSVALHYRHAVGLRQVVEDWGAARADEFGLRPQSGRMVLELLPPIRRDKGDVVQQETQDLRAAWFFGDDLSDLAAFQALDARCDVDPDFLAVRAAVTNDETGHPVRARADITVPSSEDLPTLLEQVIEGIDAVMSSRSATSA